jgi:hypothetical protein
MASRRGSTGAGIADTIYHRALYTAHYIVLRGPLRRAETMDRTSASLRTEARSFPNVSSFADAERAVSRSGGIGAHSQLGTHSSHDPTPEGSV